jgi:hypothetical protein
MERKMSLRICPKLEAFKHGRNIILVLWHCSREEDQKRNR